MKRFCRSFILIILVLAGATISQSAAKVSPVHVTLRIFEIVDCKTNHHSAMTLRRTQERYCFAGETIVDETQVESASVWNSEYDDKPGLRLIFKPEGAARLREISTRLMARTESPGRLGVVVNDKLVSVATVRTVVATDLVISNAFNAEECHQLVAALNAPAHQSKE